MQTYVLGTCRMRVLCDEPQQQVQLETLWRMLFSLPDGETVCAPNSVFTLHLRHPDGGSIPRPDPTGPLSKTGPLQGYRTASGFYLRCQKSALALDLSAAQGVGVLHDEFWRFPLAQQREFFLVMLLMVARQSEFYGIHANGLRRDGAGVLLIGESGSGKTTLTLALVRTGWQYVADDTVLLHQAPTSIDALALRRGFSCKPKTLAHLAAAGIHARGPALGDGKQLIPIEQIRADSFAPSCTPTALLFPTIAGGTHSRLEPVTDSFALTAVMGLSAGILIDRDRVVKQMALLKQLVQQTRCYRLCLGDDVFHNPRAVSALLQQE